MNVHQTQSLPITFFLAMGHDDESLQAGGILSKFGIACRISACPDGTICSQHGRVKTPVLTVVQSLPQGRSDRFDIVGLREIANFTRRWTLRRQDDMDNILLGTSDYDVDSNKSSHFMSGEKGIVCFDERGYEIYRGALSASPYPVLHVFAKGKLGGVGSMWQIAAWQICHLDRDDFQNARAVGTPFINKVPPAVLTHTEVQQLGRLTENGRKDVVVIVQDSGCMAQYWFEAYFTANNQLYRLGALDPD